MANNVNMDGVHSVTVFEHVKPMWREDKAPRIMEPDKCEEWRWCRVDQLPEPLFAPLAALVASPYWQDEVLATKVDRGFFSQIMTQHVSWQQSAPLDIGGW